MFPGLLCSKFSKCHGSVLNPLSELNVSRHDDDLEFGEERKNVRQVRVRIFCYHEHKQHDKVENYIENEGVNWREVRLCCPHVFVERRSNELKSLRFREKTWESSVTSWNA